MNVSKVKLIIAFAILAGIVFFSVTQLKPKTNLGTLTPDIEIVRNTLSSSISVFGFLFNEPTECVSGKANHTACTSDTKSAQTQYENCENLAHHSLSGTISSSFSADCDLKTDGSEYTKTINLTSPFPVQSALGLKLTHINDALFKLNIMDIQAGNTTIRTVSELALQNPKLPSFQISEGKLEVSFHQRRVIAELEIISPLKIESEKCCYPIAGEFKVSIKSSLEEFKAAFTENCGKMILSENLIVDLQPCF